LVWIDRSGRTLERIGPTGVYRGFSTSPDGDHVAVSLLDGRTGEESIWVIETRSNDYRRLTFGPGRDLAPIFSADGRRIVFTSNREGRRYMYEVAVDGSQPQRLTSSDGGNSTHWSHDGRFVVFNSVTPETGFDVSVLPLTGDRRPFAFLQTAFDERDGQLSPDGRWMAYASGESGRGGFEVYLRPFPTSHGRLQVSMNGGSAPKWRDDGQELFYLAPDGALMTAAVHSDPTFGADSPRLLFKTDLKGVRPGRAGNQREYDVTGDGQRFLFLESIGGSTPPPMTVVVDWQTLLHR
jgi:Tol biopolymer transport system component